MNAWTLLLVATLTALFPIVNPKSYEEQQESLNKEDISFTPLAMPTLSGPGAIAVTFGLTDRVHRWGDYTAMLATMLLVAFSCWLILQASTKVPTVLGVTGMNVVTRMMGFLTLCKAVQFIIKASFPNVFPAKHAKHAKKGDTHTFFSFAYLAYFAGYKKKC